MMNLVVTSPQDDFDALKRVEARSNAYLTAMDQQESLVEPMAAFALAIDKLAMLTIGSSARVLLTLEQVMVGLQAELQMSPMQADIAGDSVLSTADVVKDNLKTLHDQTNIITSNSANPNVRELGKNVLLIIRRMFDGAEQIRWTVMELQADADIEAGRVDKFSSVEDLLTHLQRASE